MQCKTDGCECDLDYTGAATTGVGSLPPFDPKRPPYRFFAISVMGDPGELTCPECRQTHEYSNEDIEEKLILEAEVGDRVLVLGQAGRFEFTGLNGQTATVKLLAKNEDAPVDPDYVIQVPYFTLRVYKPKEQLTVS